MLWSASRAMTGAPGAPVRPGDLRAMALATRRGWVRMLRDPRGPAGFIARDGGRIHALYVHPRAQGAGLGRVLIREAKQQAAQLDLYVLAANLPARRFYAAQGFAEATRGCGMGNDAGLRDIRMVWWAGTSREREAA